MSLLNEEELKLFQEILVELRALRVLMTPAFVPAGSSTYMYQCAACQAWYSMGASHVCSGKITYSLAPSLTT